MKNIFTILPFICLLFFGSCKQDKVAPIDTASMKISFKATYGNEPMVIDSKTTYQYDGKPVRFSKINFYISNLVVLSDAGERELAEVYFLDLTKTHNSIEKAAIGTVVEFKKIPVGNYSGPFFGMGVPADLNRSTPADYSNSHPLGANNKGEYNEDWNSYIFAKFEGQYDLDGNGFDENDITFIYHTGRDISYLPIEFDNFKTLKAGETTNVNFELDIKELFSFQQGDQIPLEAYDPNNQTRMMLLLKRNYERALKIVH